MISSIELKWFKCFRHQRFPLAPLTMLSGTNASGKSTVFQAMVLLHQTMVANEWTTRLQLNAGELELGTVADVIDKVHGRVEFRISLADSQTNVEWTFGTNGGRQAMSAPVTSVVVNGKTTREPSRLHFLLPDDGHAGSDLTNAIRGLTYLTAERTGPRSVYQLQDPEAMQVVGPRGDNAVGMLYQNRDQRVEDELAIAPVPPTLLQQVGNRMSGFFPGAALDVQQVENTNYVTLGLKTSDETGFHRPMHVGFGLTQVLPIVVAALVARKGDVLLIENPEVHLHPAGQAAMGGFLTEVAASGVQVLVETHSDHVLNGIRRKVKSNSIDHNNVQLHFIRPREEPGAQVTSPQIDENGNIDEWPDGFFDQFDKDMNHFAGWD